MRVYGDVDELVTLYYSAEAHYAHEYWLLRTWVFDTMVIYLPQSEKFLIMHNRVFIDDLDGSQ
jgi:hypothetical protein